MIYRKSILICAFGLSSLMSTTSVISKGPDFSEKDNLLEKRRQTKVGLQAQKPKKKFTPQKMSQAPIGISYRADGEGKGAFYDHYTVQRSTKHETRLVRSVNTQSKLHSFAKAQTFNLLYGAQDKKTMKKLPFVREGWDEASGLLFLPGRIRGDEDQDRKKFEQDIIRKARLQGRPILAVCAGSWRLWEAYGGTTKEVKDHNYNGGMLRLNEHGTITYNVQVHGIKTLPHTLLTSIMGGTPEEEVIEAVNSVHWLAPDDSIASPTLPKNKQYHGNIKALYGLLQVSARALEDEDISLKNRQGEVMAPEEETVEAFETKSGAPTMGILWHAEAYCHYKEGNKIYYHSKHRNILEFMAKAGDAYAARRRMLKEFSAKYKIKN